MVIPMFRVWNMRKKEAVYKELIERNTAIAINKGFVILDKENTLYDIYANKKCPYAYRANPIH